MFQSEPAQFECISCDRLGSFYQELPGRTICSACPVNTQRFLGVLSGATVAACQCKEGKALASSSVQRFPRSVCPHLVHSLDIVCPHLVHSLDRNVVQDTLASEACRER